MDDDKQSPAGSEDELNEHEQFGRGQSYSYGEQVKQSGTYQSHETDPLTEGYEDEDNMQDENQQQGAHEAQEEEYQFLDEDEMSNLDLDEKGGEAHGGLLANIRAKLVDLIGEDNFDRLKGMAIPIVVVAVFIIIAVGKLSSLFSTPATTPQAQVASVQTQITPATSTTPVVTTQMMRPNEVPASEPAESTPSSQAQSTTPATEMTTQAVEVPPVNMAGSNQAPASAEVSSAEPAPSSSDTVAGGLRSLLSGGNQGGQYQMQPGAPGFTAAVPSALPAITENMIKMVQEDNAKQTEAFIKQMSSLDDQTKAMDDRLVRLEKMQESLDKKMESINGQLDKVGQSMVALNKSLKAKPKREDFTYHGAEGSMRAERAPTTPGTGGRRTPPPGVQFETPYYHVEAVIPGRAWLKDQNGTVVTVGKGDQIRGYGFVTFIDAENGYVVTSSGVVVRYGIDTH